MNKANDIQIGGKHYESQYQHWDLVLNYQMPYLLGCASKYVTRSKDNRAIDLKKAKHYLVKLAENISCLQPMHDRAGHRTNIDRDIESYSIANRLSMREHRCILSMVMIINEDDVQDVIRQVDGLIEEALLAQGF